MLSFTPSIHPHVDSLSLSLLCLDLSTLLFNAGVAAARDDGAACGVGKRTLLPSEGHSSSHPFTTGVAYRANIAGIRLISAPITYSDIATSQSYHTENNHIFSNSWGFPRKCCESQWTGEWKSEKRRERIWQGENLVSDKCYYSYSWHITAACDSSSTCTLVEMSSGIHASLHSLYLICLCISPYLSLSFLTTYLGWFLTVVANAVSNSASSGRGGKGNIHVVAAGTCSCSRVVIAVNLSLTAVPLRKL